MTGLKRNSAWLVCLTAIMLFNTWGLSAQNIKVEARLDSNRLLIGDQVGLHLSAIAPAGTLILWPRIPDTIYNNIQVIDRSKTDTSFSEDKKMMTIHQRLLLTSFDSGFYTLPPIAFRYRVPPDTTTRMEETDMLLLNVNTVAVDTTKTIKPIKGPMKAPLTFRDFLPWILGLLGLGIIVAGVIYYLRRRRKHAPIFNLIQKAPLKPYEIALNNLEDLRGKKIWQAGRYKEYHSELTDILRKYIEEFFAVQALESTTDEIMEGLRDTDRVTPENLQRLRGILTLADLVKFAKERPAGNENEEKLNEGILFVKETIPESVQPEPEPENQKTC